MSNPHTENCEWPSITPPVQVIRVDGLSREDAFRTVGRENYPLFITLVRGLALVS